MPSSNKPIEPFGLHDDEGYYINPVYLISLDGGPLSRVAVERLWEEDNRDSNHDKQHK